MFVIELTYNADLAEIDAHMKPHVAFLKKHYDAGSFLVSGRKIPRDGGITLALHEVAHEPTQSEHFDAEEIGGRNGVPMRARPRL